MSNVLFLILLIVIIINLLKGLERSPSPLPPTAAAGQYQPGYGAGQGMPIPQQSVPSGQSTYMYNTGVPQPPYAVILYSLE